MEKKTKKEIEKDIKKDTEKEIKKPVEEKKEKVQEKTSEKKTEKVSEKKTDKKEVEITKKEIVLAAVVIGFFAVISICLVGYSLGPKDEINERFRSLKSRIFGTSSNEVMYQAIASETSKNVENVENILNEEVVEDANQIESENQVEMANETVTNEVVTDENTKTEENKTEKKDTEKENSKTETKKENSGTTDSKNTSGTTNKKEETTSKPSSSTSTSTTTKPAVKEEPVPYVTGTDTEEKLTNTETKYGVVTKTYTTTSYDLYSDGTKRVTGTDTRTECDQSGFSASTSALLSEAKQNKANYASMISSVHSNVNTYRADADAADGGTRGKLTLDTNLTIAACVRATEMAYSGKHSHTRPNGSSCFTVLSDMGISAMAYGENIAEGYSSAASVSKGWKNSSGHYKNMISEDYSKIGIGVAKFNGRYYWCQLFTA